MDMFDREGSRRWKFSLRDRHGGTKDLGHCGCYVG